MSIRLRVAGEGQNNLLCMQLCFGENGSTNFRLKNVSFPPRTAATGLTLVGLSQSANILNPNLNF